MPIATISGGRSRPSAGDHKTQTDLEANRRNTAGSFSARRNSHHGYRRKFDDSQYTYYRAEDDFVNQALMGNELSDFEQRLE
jgi:hypothetical protein